MPASGRPIHNAILKLLNRAPAQLFFFRCYNRLTKLFVRRALVQTDFGCKVYCEPADLIQSMIYHFGVWEPAISAVVKRLLAPGDVVADVGANIGYASLLASKIVGPNGGVVAIEAEPATHQKLRENLQANPSAMNVRTLNVAVSDAPGSLTLFTGNESNIGAASVIASSNRRESITVDAFPLDQLLTDDERMRLRLIKIDIEGAEPAVLRRFLQTLDLYGPRTCLIVEASPQIDRKAWSELFTAFKEAGFYAYGIENSYSPVWYLNWRDEKPLVELRTMPDDQIDILFIPGHSTMHELRRSFSVTRSSRSHLQDAARIVAAT